MGFVHLRENDYRRSLDEFEGALKGLPNDARVWRYLGVAHRRLGDWHETTEVFERAAKLDPRDADVFLVGGPTYQLLRRYADAVRAYDQALSLAPDLHEAAIRRGWTYVQWHGLLDALRAALGRVPRDANLGWGLTRDQDIVGQSSYLTRDLYIAWVHQLSGDQAARAAFEAALVHLDSVLSEFPDDYLVHAARGLGLAGLGHRDEALREARWLQQST